MLCLLSDELLSENFLDYKNRGINGSHRGQIIWKIDSSSHFTEGTRSTAEPRPPFLAFIRNLSHTILLCL